MDLGLIGLDGARIEVFESQAGNLRLRECTLNPKPKTQ